MNLAYIINRVCSEEGIGNISADSAQRIRLLHYINEAVDRLYQSADLDGADQEITLTTTPDSELVLPAYVQRPIALRDSDTQERITLQGMRPRYCSSVWSDTWNNWRDKGFRALAVELGTATTLRFSSGAEPTDAISVLITGSTADAQNKTESLVLTWAGSGAGYVDSATTWTSVKSLSFTKLPPGDITVTNIATSEVVAVMYNNMLDSRYHVLDVSEFPWGSGATGRNVDLLYRPRTPRLENDADVFPIPGYENVLVRMTLGVMASYNAKKFQNAQIHEATATAQLNRKTNDEQKNKEAGIQFAPSPYHLDYY